MGKLKNTEGADKPKRVNYNAKGAPVAPDRPTNDKGLPTKRQPPAKKNVYRVPFELNTGRPSTFNYEVANAICVGKAQGIPLRTICKMDGMPSLTTVYDWLRRYPEFAKLYASANSDMADTLAEETIAIADNTNDDQYVDENGKLVGNHVAVNRDRLRVDARKWFASKMKPDKYGEKIVHQGDPDAPLVAALVAGSADLLAKLRGSKS